VIAKMTLVRERFFAGLRAEAPQMPVGNEEVAAVDGAIWRAKGIAEG
jgi:hypothetical protein